MADGTYFIKELRELYDKRKGEITAKEKERLKSYYGIDSAEFDEILYELSIYKPITHTPKRPLIIVSAIIVLFAFLIFQNIGKIKNTMIESIAASSESKQESEPEKMPQPASKSTETTSQDEIPIAPSNPNQTYNNLIKEALLAYGDDKLEKALEKVTLAAIVKSDFGLRNSSDAESLYSQAYSNGDLLLEMNDKSLMPLAKIHFQIAQQIEESSGISQKVSKCK